MRVHLDVLGGIAGDMFIAALLDAFPEHQAGMLASIRAVAPPGTQCVLVSHNDGVFRGRRFEVSTSAAPPPSERQSEPGHAHIRHDHGHSHDHEHDHDHDHAADGGGHDHQSWRAIRVRLEEAAIDPGAKAHALAIFALLAEAEGRVHGVAADEVQFHEVGAWDSIADIVGAGHLIATLGAERWSASTLPLGGGRVRTAHGLMPVPAPATALLLEGFGFIDDGAPGERITPTGAAILRHLCPPGAELGAGPAVLSGSGVGFGTRRLTGVSNCLRALVFEEPGKAAAPSHRELLVVEFEVDDQSAEDLAMGLEHLRGHADVFDVIQAPVFGKKGRMMTYVRLLARSDALEAVTEAAFRETSTIGLRHHRVGGAALVRAARQVAVDGRQLRVKTVDRPGGRTAKAEADDVRADESHAARTDLRRAAERAALDSEDAA